MSPKTETQKPAKRTTATRRGSKVFTDEERAAMKEYAKERKAAASRGPRASKADGERDVLAKISEMKGTDRSLAERIHAIVKDTAPDLAPRTYYGMPAYAKDGKVLCYFKPALKFKERYATFGFNDSAKLDEGAIWPTTFAVTELTPEVEARIGELVKQAAA